MQEANPKSVPDFLDYMLDRMREHVDKNGLTVKQVAKLIRKTECTARELLRRRGGNVCRPTYRNAFAVMGRDAWREAAEDWERLSQGGSA